MKPKIMEEEQQENRNENQQANIIIQESRSTSVDYHLQLLLQSFEYDHQQAAAGMEDIRGKLKSPAMYPPLPQGPSQRIEDIRGKTRSPAMYYSQVLQRGQGSYEYAQGMENIRGKLKSPAALYSQVPRYGFGQGIEDIRGKLKSPAMHPADEPQKVPRFGSGQGIENIRGKLISPAMYRQLQQGPRDEKKRIDMQEQLQEMENLMQTLKSHTELLQQKPRNGFEKWLGYSQPLKDSVYHAIKNLERMQDIDVIDITSYSYDVLEAVEYVYLQGIDNVLLDERPEVFELVVYFNHYDVNKIRLKAQKELVLLKEEFDDIEKHPQVPDKIKTLQAVLRICDAEKRSNTTVSSTM